MKFDIVPQNLNAVAIDLKEIEQCLQQLYEETYSITKRIAYQEFDIGDIKSTLETHTKKILTLADDTRVFNGGFVSIIDLYNKTENKIVGNVSVTDVKEEEQAQNTGSTEEVDAVGGAKIKKITYAEGEKIIGAGSIGGIPFEAKVYGDFLSASYDTKATAGVTYKRDANGNDKLDSVGAQAIISGEAHIASGKIKKSAGYLSNETTVTVGAVGAVGSLGANLYKEGRLTPQVYAKLQASAVAAKGSASTSVGSDNNNVHIKAAGELGTASAKAEAAVGEITVKDDNGNVSTAYGATLSAGAEAYVATGKVSGGIEILGIQVDVGATGKAGGVGAKAGATVTTGGFKGSADVGVGLGVGLDISVDWSNFKLGW